MKERGLMFNGESVRAILEGKKTETRRVAKDGGCTKSPFGEIGDYFYVKEAWGLDIDANPIYFADYIGQERAVSDVKERSVMFMPREYSRITLKITDVRIERLQEITEENAKAEGAEYLVSHTYPNLADFAEAHHLGSGYKLGFAHLWDSLNAKRGFEWAKNPWVWVISFKRVEKEKR